MGLYTFLNAARSRGPYYVQIRRDRLQVRDVARGTTFDDEPLVAISRAKPAAPLAIGTAARAARNATVVNPFDHPRVIVDDFAVAETLLSHAFREVAGRTRWRPHR